MNVHWYHKIPNKVILKKAGLPSMADILIQRNLRWVGHIHRLDNDRLPRNLLYSQLAIGKRNIGRPLLRFKDVVKRNFKSLGIDSGAWQTAAMDRELWRSIVRRE